MAGRALAAVTITTGTNHAGVKKFWGFSFRCSASSQVRFRQAAVGGAIIWPCTIVQSTKQDLILPLPILTPGGVYVELISGTITEGVMLSG